MEGTERPYITEGAHVTNNTLKADTLMPFFFFFFGSGSHKSNCFQKLTNININKIRVKKLTKGKNLLNNN